MTQAGFQSELKKLSFDWFHTVGNQNLSVEIHFQAMNTLKRNTDMKFIVRTNLFGYKKMLSELNGAKLNPRVNQQDQKETRKSARPKIFTSLFGKNKQKNLLPNHPKHPTAMKPKTPSHDSGSADNEQTEFQGKNVTE